jgi:pimeloyl-ACP methyl ester carboxylesterase
MPLANVRGVNINYEVIGAAGPWVSLAPGGRRDIEWVRTLAGLLASQGYRVLIHDRRNCGASDVAFDGSASEYEVWADDLHALLTQLNALPCVIGGSSSGCRMSVLMALRHPEAVRALILWRVTGGKAAATRLARTYYADFIEVAKQGGMSAVCETEHFRERIRQRPQNRERLMAMEVQKFIDVMAHWRQYFVDSMDLPIIGATDEELRRLTMPVCIIPGNDNSHPKPVAENLARILPNAELHHVQTVFHDADLGPDTDWTDHEPDMARIFGDFLARHGAVPSRT